MHMHVHVLVPGKRKDVLLLHMEVWWSVPTVPADAPASEQGKFKAFDTSQTEEVLDMAEYPYPHTL